VVESGYCCDRVTVCVFGVLSLDGQENAHSSMLTAVDLFRRRASLIFTGIEILPDLSILAILCRMPCWVLLG